MCKQLQCNLLAFFLVSGGQQRDEKVETTKTVKYAGDVKEGLMACMTQKRVEVWIVPGLKSGGGGIVVYVYKRQGVGRRATTKSNGR